MSKVSQLFQQNLTRIWIWICSFWLVLMPFLKGKVRHALHTWRNWPASEFWKCIILCWFITLFPMWVRALFKHLLLDLLPADPYSSWPWVSFWVLLSLPLTPSPSGKPSEGWLEPAQEQSCVQDVYAPKHLLPCLQSAVWPRAIVQGLCSVTLSSETVE